MAGDLLQKGGLFNGIVIDDSAAAAGNNSLTSLAAGSAATTGTTNFDGSPGAKPTSIDNGALGGDTLTLNIALKYAVAPTAGKTFDVYILYSTDAGATYGGGTPGATPTTVQAHWIGNVTLVNAVTQPTTTIVKKIRPLKFQLQFVNNGDQALAAQNGGSSVQADVQAGHYT